MSDEPWAWMGYRVEVDPAVPEDVAYRVDARRAVIAFRDRYALLRTVYWLALTPRLNQIARQCWEDWRRERGGRTGP